MRQLQKQQRPKTKHCRSATILPFLFNWKYLRYKKFQTKSISDRTVRIMFWVLCEFSKKLTKIVELPKLLLQLRNRRVMCDTATLCPVTFYTHPTVCVDLLGTGFAVTAVRMVFFFSAYTFNIIKPIRILCPSWKFNISFE